MTKEEALKQLRLGPGINEDVSEEYNDAVDMAIKALEQQPSDDCVSREQAKKEIIQWYRESIGNKPVDIDKPIQIIQDLSPVTPTHCIATVKFSKEDLREICNERIEIECTHGTCKDCKHWKDSDGVYRRGVGAESKCHINILQVYEGNFYCADFEKRGNENG